MNGIDVVWLQMCFICVFHHHRFMLLISCSSLQPRKSSRFCRFVGEPQIAPEVHEPNSDDDRQLNQGKMGRRYPTRLVGIHYPTELEVCGGCIVTVLKGDKGW